MTDLSQKKRILVLKNLETCFWLNLKLLDVTPAVTDSHHGITVDDRWVTTTTSVLKTDSTSHAVSVPQALCGFGAVE